ncbi:hypothetical protein NIES4071_39010 [Calothrix sp. NIES-4071]|nr:hypothetical protein NIES4071_39010 [Calothrix sp. NIES-4071]BAZ58219.1 hypothetical protein NIES4105_38950 [Calothrix sp. NIES-4105]
MKHDFNNMTKTELRAYVVAHSDDQEAFYAFVDSFTEEAPQETFPPITSEAEVQEVAKLIRQKVEQRKIS